MEFYTSRELALIWDITPRRIQMLCAKGDIPGAVKMGRDWLIPKNAPRPIDTRKKEYLHTQKGFTLIEMLVVIAIIAVLVAVIIPTVTSSIEKAKEATDAANIRSAYSKVLTEAMTSSNSEFWNEESGIWASTPVQLRQSTTGWQDETTNSSITGLGSQIGSPTMGGYATVEFHPNGDQEHPTVIVRYSDSSGQMAINYKSTQSVGKYVFSEVQNLLDKTKSNTNEDAKYNKIFTAKSDTNIDSELILPNGEKVNVIVYSRSYDTFEYVNDRFKTEKTATLIYNRTTGELSTIIYFDGTGYSSWSVDSDSSSWSEDSTWLENAYAKKK